MIFHLRFFLSCLLRMKVERLEQISVPQSSRLSAGLDFFDISSGLIHHHKRIGEGNECRHSKTLKLQDALKRQCL